MRSRAPSTRRPDDDTLLSLLQCPVTQQRLVPERDGSLATPDGARRYPVVSGVPMMIVRERSLFGAEVQTLVVGGGYSRRDRIDDALVAAAKRAVPSISRNVKARENFRELARQLTSHEDERTTKRVLVVGGAVMGEGIEELLSAPHIETVETDVVIGPRTHVLCDAHDLPFVDGSFDAVVCQAVLGSVVNPERVVAEIHRVLRTDGIVYSETNFLQGVCMGRYDFTRHTHLGHRRLFREFDEISSGVQCGPGMSLAWMVVWFFMALAGGSRVARAAARGVVPFFVFWLPHLDRYLVDKPGAYDAASGTFFLGRRRPDAVPDQEIIRGYRGAVSTGWTRARRDDRVDGAAASP